MSIKTGPKRTNKDGTPDKRQRTVDPKHNPPLRKHKHTKGD